MDNTIKVWDVYDRKCLRTYEEQDSEVSVMLYSAMHGVIVTGHDSGLIKLWQPNSGTFVKLPGHRNTVSCSRCCLRCCSR